MPKRTRRKKDSASGVEGNLALRKSESIQFPVRKSHPYARFQVLRRVRSADDIPAFFQLWNDIADSREQPRPQPKRVLADLIKAKVSVLRIAPGNLDIPQGAVMVLNNPLNEIEVDRANIAGDLISRGQLFLKCNTLVV